MIETKRLIIKPLSYDELKRHVVSPNDLAEEMGLVPSKSLIDKETKDAIVNDLLPNLADSNKDPLFYTMWIMIEKSKKAIIGGICFHGEPDESGEVEIGYGTDEEFRDNGYMTETIAGLIQWLSTNRKVKILKAETDCSNKSSVKLLQKNGFILYQKNDNAVIMKLELNK